MQSSNQHSVMRPSSAPRQMQSSSILSKSMQSRLYESFKMQGESSFIQGGTYDSQYRQGFPKLYSFETIALSKSGVNNQNMKSKYSFRNESRVTEQTSILVQQNLFLTEEVNRLNVLLEAERRSTNNRTEIERLGLLLVQKDTEIRNLNQRISQLTIQLNEYQIRIGILEKDVYAARNNLQVDELKAKLEQYQIQISQYERTFAQYETQITTLQGVNWRLEQKIYSEANQRQGSEDNQWIVEQGKLNFKIIILLQEINRLKQKEQQLTLKAEELHGYLLKAENYIQEIQLELQKNNLKENVPARIVEKVTILQQENYRYSQLIHEMQERLSMSLVGVVSQQEYLLRMGERDLRIIILMQEVNRLNEKSSELRQCLIQAEDFIEQLQGTLRNSQRIIPHEIQNQLTYLSEENHRLNLLVERYISQIKQLQVNIQAPKLPKIQYQVPPEVEAKLSFLFQENQRLNRLVDELQLRPLQLPQTIVSQQQLEQQFARATFRIIVLLEEINRLNHAVMEIHGHLINAESYIEHCEIRFNELSQQSGRSVEFRAPPEVEAQLVELNQQNEYLKRLLDDIQSRPALVQTRIQHKVEFQIPPEIQTRISLLVNENQRLERELASRLPSGGDDLMLENGRLQFKAIILLEQIARLNFGFNEVKGFLVNAENYIFELEGRQQHAVSAELEQQVFQLTEQNQKLHAEINRLTQFYEQQINNFNIRATTSQAQLDQLRLSSSVSANQQELEAKWGAQHLRAIILLEEINRLNQKCADLDKERVEVIGHLINAENYIQELEIRQTHMQESVAKQSTITNNTTIEGSNSAFQQLNIHLIEVENARKIQVSSRDLRIIFLLEQINRLNHKLLNITSGPETSLSSQPQIIALRQQNQHCRAELQEVLGHLSNAENYIGQLLRDAEGYAAEREYLINELNRR